MVMDRRIQAESTGGDEREAGDVTLGAAVETGVETKEEWKLKTLSDKSREAKVKSKPRYEDTWAALHRRAKECASAGELVDSEVVMLSAHWEKKKTSLIELQEQLQQLPGLIADLESMTANLMHLETSFEEVENHLLNLEDLCAQCELERCKHTQSQQLENYKKNKRGLQPVPDEEVIDLYGGTQHIPPYQMSDFYGKGLSIKQFIDIFSLPQMPLLSCVVGHFLGHGLEFDQAHLYKDVTDVI
ncbi:Dysbindin [Myotis brandtii]|uniref:Dysbindin n=1 Tax=Myotis brandtii TaxID=109478 RepID=S7PTV9_MYOBR|nr:Dysbindin [Myotis brandtii]